MKRIQAPHYWLTALLAAALAASFAQAQPKGKSIAATGELIDMWCYYEGGDHGPSHKACATACAKSGMPLAILGDDGKIYMLASPKPADPQNSRLVDFTEAKVKVTGVHRMEKGLHTIEIKTISAAS